MKDKSLSGPAGRRQSQGGEGWHPDWLLTLLLAICLVLPRVLLPARFLTPDEVLFLDHARQFLRGLATGDLALTLGIGYPGVTVAWVGSLGLWLLYGLSRLGLGTLMTLSQFLDMADRLPMPYYVAGRLACGVFTALLLWLAYRLLRRWWSGPQAQAVALAAILLLALDPFFTGYSRLFHIAAALSLLMLMTVLAWLVWLREGKPIWLLVTGLLAGLAFLTKSTGLLLLPMLAGLALLVWLLERPRPAFAWLARPAGSWLIVFLVTGLVTVVLWPVMWQQPGEALTLTLGKLWLDKDAGEGNLGMYWMGRFVEDPGVAFYPVALLLKITPLMLLGLVVSLLPQGKGETSDLEGRNRRWVMWAYALSYLVIMTVATKKSVRYLLPGMVGLAPVAAYGWLRIWGWVRRWWAFTRFPCVEMIGDRPQLDHRISPPGGSMVTQDTRGDQQSGGKRRGQTPFAATWFRGRSSVVVRLDPADAGRQTPFAATGGRRSSLLAAVVLVVLLLGLALPYAPQFFSYYNPLVLGWRWAPHALLVGWGEGLGDAATYLNRQPGAQDARVTAWYDWTFAPFFAGQTVPFSAQEAMTADYSVLYINQVQRDIPDPNLIDYFGRRQPQHVVRLNGIEYAWIYPPVADDRPLPEGVTRLDIPMGDAVALEGYAVRPAEGDQPGLWVTLYWRCLREDLADYFVYVRAVEADDAIVARADSPPVMGFYSTSRWQKGQLVADEQVLLRPPETFPGVYRLEVGMYDPQTWAVLEPTAGTRGAGGGVILTEVELP